MIEAGNLDHAKAIAGEVGIYFNPACDKVISRSRNGKLLGGVIFTDFTKASIGIHVAGFDPRWINNDLLWITFHYPFDQLGVTKLIGRVPSSNPKALDFNRKLGFKEEARVADIYPGDEGERDLIILSMTRDNCRWLKLKPRGPPEEPVDG